MTSSNPDEPPVSLNGSRSPPANGPARLALDVTDVDEARHVFRQLYTDALLEPDGDRPFRWALAVVRYGPLTVVTGSWRDGVRLRMPVIHHRHVLSLSAGGALNVEHGGGRCFVVEPGRRAALFSPGPSADLRGAPGFEGRSIAVERCTLEAHFLALTGREARGPIAFDPAFDIDEGPGATIVEVTRTLRLDLERPEASPLLITSLAETLLTSLLTNARHSASALLDRAPPSAGELAVRRAEELIDAHAAEPITLAKIAAEVGVSIRSLQAAFRAHRGTTPSLFLRDRRLSHARRTVLAERGAGGADRAEAAARIALLSRREREVCARVARGMLNKQIAADLSIAERTVKQYRARGMAKLGANSAAELGRLFERLGE